MSDDTSTIEVSYCPICHHGAMTQYLYTPVIYAVYCERCHASKVERDFYTTAPITSMQDFLNVTSDIRRKRAQNASL